MIARILCFLFIVPFLYTLELPDAQCQKVLSHIGKLIIMQDQQTLIAEMAPYMMFSMKGLGQYGDYEACIKSHQYADVLVQFMMGGKPVSLMAGGVCITKQCSIQNLNQNMDQIQGFIQFIAKQLQIQIPPAKIELIDVSQKEDIGVDVYFTIILLVILTIIAFSLVILKQFKKQKKQNRSLYLEEVNQVDPFLRNGQLNPDLSTGSFNQLQSSSILFIYFLAQITNPLQQSEKKQESNFFIFEDFDIARNWKSLVDQKVPDPNLNIFNGLRAISFLEVIFGHVFIFCAIQGNVQEGLSQLNKPIMIFMYNCMYSVDTFFWIGGFFLAFVALDPKKRETFKKQKFVWFAMGVLNRVLRIWPAYIVTIIIFATIQPIVPSGPRRFGAVSDCSTWYEHLLFYQNLPFASQSGNCVPQDWYLACDMQIFLIGIIICFIYIQTNAKLGKGLIGLALILTQACGTYYCFEHKNPIIYLNQQDQKFQEKYYIKPWTRAPPYFLGMIFGLLYRERKAEIQKIGKAYPILFNTLCYGVSLSIIGYFFFGWYPALNEGIEFRPLNQQIFEQAFCRLLVTFAVGLMVLVNMAGYYDWVNTWFMGNFVFKFLAKISYVGYLIHWSIILIVLSIFYEGSSTSLVIFIQYFVMVTLLTVVAGTIIHLLVEAPFGNLVGRLKQKDNRAQIQVKAKEGLEKKLIDEKL